MPPLRNPTTTVAELNQRIMSLQSYIDHDIEEAEANPDNPHQYALLKVFKQAMEIFRFRYARGDAVADLASYFMLELLPFIRHAQQLTSQFFPDYVLRLHSSEQWGIPFILAIVCFDKEGLELQRLDDWIDFDAIPPELDIMLRAFIPSRPLAKKYGVNKHWDKYRIPVLRLIAADEGKRQAGLRSLLAEWPKLMKARGYRETIDDSRSRFDEFSFDAALAACAYDIDDAPFSETLFYPAEMTAYYRQHIRHTRDAWRAAGEGHGTELPAIPQLAPKKDYALKPAEAYTRWVEIACGDKPELIATVRKALGKRKSMPPLEVVMQALADKGAGTHADIKDDETLAHHVLEMCGRLSLPAFTPPIEPPQGAARCSAILSSLKTWLPEHGAQLVVLGEGGDVWDAVFINSADEPQFLALCEQLEIDVMTESDWQ